MGRVVIFSLTVSSYLRIMYAILDNANAVGDGFEVFDNYIILQHFLRITICLSIKSQH